MVHYVILNVEMDIKELDLYVGKDVQIHSEMMVHFVLNLNHMVEELVMLYGMKVNVKDKIHKDVRNMVCCIIQNVDQDFMLLDVAFVHQIVLMVKLILVYHVLKNHMEEVLVNL